MNSAISFMSPGYFTLISKVMCLHQRCPSSYSYTDVNSHLKAAQNNRETAVIVHGNTHFCMAGCKLKRTTKLNVMDGRVIEIEGGMMADSMRQG